MAYRYRTKPFPHQRKAFAETANLVAYGLLWEQGVGKTKPLIDTMSYLFVEGKVRGVIIVAPNGVHRNWITDEIPRHMPQEVLDQVKYLVWDSSKFDQKGVSKRRKEVEKHAGLAVVLVCYEATIRPKFKNWAKRFMDKAERPCMMILDESHKIKDPDSKVKTTCVALGGHAHYRRIATGTPIERPFDIYSQLRFLQPMFWKSQGFPTYEDFKQYFGIFRERNFGGRSFDQLVAHKNLDHLAEMVKMLTWRLTKEQAGLDLPPKVYTKRYHEMLPEQLRVYDELRDQFRTTLPSGDVLEAPMAITRLLRLQQIVCGYVACEAEQPVQLIDPVGRNPRMDLACDEILEDLNEPAIIFSRFTPDIDELMRRLGNQAVRYDGRVNQEDRALAKARFQAGDAKYFVMSNAGATGLTLIQASFFLTLANDFSLINRQQREDRCHRIGQTKSVTYCDLCCYETVDDYIIGKLSDKFDIVNQVTLDDIRPFLT